MKLIIIILLILISLLSISIGTRRKKEYFTDDRRTDDRRTDDRRTDDRRTDNICDISIDKQLNNTCVYDIPWETRKENKFLSTIPTIFVLIASYRDDQCPITVKELFSKSKYPTRVFVGIYQQNDEDKDVDCFFDSIKSKSVITDNIKINKVKHTDAKGPCIGKYNASLLYNNEDYLLLIDSHMRCLYGWDESLIEMFNECKNSSTLSDKIVLSQYPLEFNVKEDKFPDNFKSSTTSFCEAIFNNDGIIQPKSHVVANWNEKDKKFEVPFIAGGMMFSKGKLLKDVPLDPTLIQLFHGEELLYSIRLYAAGYKIYAPPKNMLFHFYERKNYPKVWDNEGFYKENSKTLKAVKKMLLLNGNEDLNKEEEGDRDILYKIDPQTVRNYYDKFKINIKEKKADNWCKS